MAVLISPSVAGKGLAVRRPVVGWSWRWLPACRATTLSRGVLPLEPQHLPAALWGKGGALCPFLAALTDVLSLKLPFPSIW